MTVMARREHAAWARRNRWPYFLSCSSPPSWLKGLFFSQDEQDSRDGWHPGPALRSSGSAQAAWSQESLKSPKSVAKKVVKPRPRATPVQESV
jgi:hypothetical protein